MGRLFTLPTHNKFYFFQKNKKVLQKLTYNDFCDTILIADDIKNNIIIKKYYKEFILIAEAVIFKAEKEEYTYITHWKGHIKVNSEDKKRRKNLLIPLRKVYVHGSWISKKDECLTFECNNYNDLYLYYDEVDKCLIFKNSKSTFKNYEWIFEELEIVIDEIY